MSSVKKRLLIIGMICIILAAAVATVCIFAVPFGGSDIGSGAIAAPSATGDYTVAAPSYNTGNSAYVYANYGSSNDEKKTYYMYYRYPSKIYLDASKGETLQSAGYTITFFGRCNDGDNRYIVIPKAIYGDWQQSTNGSSGGQNTNSDIGAYFGNTSTTHGYYASFKSGDYAINRKDDDNWTRDSVGYKSHYYQIDTKDTFEWTFNLNGTPSSSISGNGTSMTINGLKIYFVPRATAWNGSYYDKTMTSLQSTIVADKQPSWISSSTFSSTSIGITLYRYTTNELVTAIDNLQTYIDSATIKGLVTSTSIAAAQTKINEAKTLLTKRDKTQKEIDDMKTALNDWTFDSPKYVFIGDSNVNFGDKTFAENYNDVFKSSSTTQRAANGTLPDFSTFFDVKYKNGASGYPDIAASAFTPYGDTTTKNFYLPTGNLSLYVSAKTATSRTYTVSGISHVINACAEVKKPTTTTAINNTTGFHVWLFIKQKTGESMELSENTFTYTGNNYAVGGQISDLNNANIISSTFATKYVNNLGSNYQYEYSVDGNTWSSTIDLCDVCSYSTINYRIKTTSNNFLSSGSTIMLTGTIDGGLSVEKANIELLLNKYSVPYNGALPTQDTFLNMVAQADALRNLAGVSQNATIEELRTKLGTIAQFNLGSSFDMSDSSKNNARNYTLRVASYKTMEGSSKSWGDNVTISFKDACNDNCYTVSKLKLEITWTPAGDTTYNGSGGKRPAASIRDMADPLTADDLEDAGVTAVTVDGYTPTLVNGRAVNYGRYTASVRLRDYSVDDESSAYLQNYEINNPTCEFEISKRSLTVQIKATGDTYGSQQADEMIGSWIDIDDDAGNIIYQVVSGSIVTGQRASSVFELEIDSTGRGGTAGIPAGGLYLNAGKYDIKGKTINQNYDISFIGSGSTNPKVGTFTVSKGTLDIDIAQISNKRYNRQYQSITLTNSNLRAFFADGNTDYDLANISIEYSLNATAGFSQTLTVKHVKMNGSTVAPYVVYYRIVSDNYEDYGYDTSASYNATITRLPIEVDVHRSTGITYGASGTKNALGYPTSAEIKDACLTGTGYYAVIDGVRQGIDLSDTTEFYLVGADETQKLTAGSYSIAHRAKAGADDYTTNYSVEFKGTTTAQFVVGKADLYFDWTVSEASEWGEKDGHPTYVYDNTSEENMITYGDSASAGKITIVPNSNYVYYSDVIIPQVELRDGNSGSTEAFSENVGMKSVYAHLIVNGDNIDNYTLKTSWFEFEIVKRPVSIELKDMSYVYGTLSGAASTATGLGSLSSAKLRWGYAADNVYEFVEADHRRAYGTSTPAKATTAGEYIDVGRYPLFGGELYTGDEEYDIIYGNYEVTWSGNWTGEYEDEDYTGIAGVVEITRARITRTLPLESEQFVYNGNAHTLTKEILKNTIIAGNVIINAADNSDNMEVWFTDIIASSDDTPSNHNPISGNKLPTADANNSSWTHKNGVSAEMTNVGTYDFAMWIKGVSNYQDLVMGVYVQITPSSVVVTLSGKINVVYGDALYDKATLKSKIAELVTSIQDSSNSETTYENTKLNDWIDEFQVVGGEDASMTTINDNVGDYAIRIKTRTTEGDSVVLRFASNGGSSSSSIIGVYHVDPRPLQVSWADCEFVYGEHRHATINITKVSEDDDIDVDFESDVRVTDINGGTTGMYRNHARDKGEYKATIVSISGTNGTSANVSMKKYTLEGMNETDKTSKITITARNITVRFTEQSEHTYGEAITNISDTTSGLNNYLYQRPTTIEISSGTLANNATLGITDNSNIRNVITISISYVKGATDNNNYVPVGSYNLIGSVNTEARGSNYNVSFVLGSGNTVLTNGVYENGYVVKAANIRQLYDAKELLVYDGNEHNVVFLERGFVLRGDGAVTDTEIGDGTLDDGVVNTLNYTIQYMPATKEGNTAPTVNDAGWSNTWKVKNAGEYYNWIKITADNHNPAIWKVEQSVASVDLLIKVDETSITYGDNVPNRETLYTKLNPVYTLTYDGDEVEVEGIDTALWFKVVRSIDEDETGLTGRLNAGKYSVIHYGRTEGITDNFNITYYVSGEDDECNIDAFTVNRKELTIQRDEFDYANTAWSEETEQMTIEGNNVTVYKYVYNGEVPTIRVSATGALAGQTVNVNQTIRKLEMAADRADVNSNVGLYRVVMTVSAGSNSNNYRIPDNETLYYEIVAREVEIEIGRIRNGAIGDMVRTYGTYAGTVPEGYNSENESNGLIHQVNKDDPTKTFVGGDLPVIVNIGYDLKAGEKYVPVGSYNFDVDTRINPNYEITITQQYRYVVNRATMQPNRERYETTYNGAALSVDVKSWLAGKNSSGEDRIDLKGDVTVDMITVQYLVDGNYVDALNIDGVVSGQEVEYRITAPNHATCDGSINVYVNRANVTLNVSKINVTYGDEVLSSDEIYAQGRISTGADLAVDLKDILTFRVSNSGIDAGSYNISYDFKSGVRQEWFRISFVSNCNVNAYVVAPKAVSITWGNEELTYNGETQAPSAVVNGILDKDKDAYELIFDGMGIDAVKHTVKVLRISNNNYELIGNLEKEYTIKPRVAELTWHNLNLIYDGEVKKPFATLSNRCGNDTYSLTLSDGNANAGTYTVTVLEISNSNYVLPNDESAKSTEYTIEQATLKIGWEIEGESFTYNAKVQHPRAVLSGDIYNGDECVILYEITTLDGIEADGIAAGRYVVNVIGVSNDNYKLQRLLQTEYEIVKKTITFVWKESDLVYTGEAQLPEYRIDGKVAGETPFDFSGEAIKAGNNYTAVATLNSDNYIVKNGVVDGDKVTVSTTYSIAKANNTLKVEYDRIDWTSGDKPSEETLPEAQFGKVTIKYYTDKELKNEYTGAFDEKTPDGTYWVVVTTDSTDDYIGTTSVYSFVVSSGTSIELYVIGIVVSLALLAAGIIVAKKADKKRI